MPVLRLKACPRVTKANNPGRRGWGVKTLALISLIIGGLLGALVLLAGILYMSDYGLEATVVEKSCIAAGPFGTGGRDGGVTVQTKMLGIRHVVQDVDATACSAIQPGNFVIFHIRSGATYLFESEGGACIYPPEAASDGTCV